MTFRFDTCPGCGRYFSQCTCEPDTLYDDEDED